MIQRLKQRTKQRRSVRLVRVLVQSSDDGVEWSEGRVIKMRVGRPSVIQARKQRRRFWRLSQGLTRWPGESSSEPTTWASSPRPSTIGYVL